MLKLARPVALVVAALTLGSISPAKEIHYSAETLKALDPTVQLASLCGGKNSAASMRTLMMASAAVAQGAEVPKIRLYDGLGKVGFAATANAEAQRHFGQG